MTYNIVAKFGGTSVKTADSIRKVANIVKADENIRVVVVSAVGGVTNFLVDLCSATGSERDRLVKKIKDTHLDLANDLELSIDNKIIATIEKLEVCLLTPIIPFPASSLTKAPKVLEIGDLVNTPEIPGLAASRLARDDELSVYSAMRLGIKLEQIDRILSFGEDLSSLIVHAFFELQNMSSTHIDMRNYLITDDHFGKATPDLKLIAERAKAFPKGLCVTQGFIGSSKDGKTTTLGRGGSDYSAALIAEAIKANELLIYTDVPGVYTMDPNIVPFAHLIEELCFQEMAEMANFGAKILHPATLEPCVRGQIPVRILSTFEPEKEGTYISILENKDLAPQVRAITMRKNQILVTIKSLKMLNAYGFLANIFNILAKHKISVDLITTSEVSVALTIDGTNLGSHAINPFISDKLLSKDLEEFAEIVVEEDLTLIAVIGSGLTIPGVIQATLSIIEPYMVRLVCYGASNSSIGLLVNKNDAVEMAQILHQKLLGGGHV